ncbi:hypothetical protein J2S10_003155 [Neobacillus ginsengisoli]|uniref:Uncharacterized protein n=1 Tax=Neobacillus ginsengisoli TaxID=904295 RepID=A0ABT9XWM3_9BACI|nr:hypothetical protein [Neobacillus ginsengisoli]
MSQLKSKFKWHDEAVNTKKIKKITTEIKQHGGTSCLGILELT